MADENVEAAVITGLRERGHDVLAVAEEAPGATDDDVLALSRRTRRILVTNDKDFAQLTFLQRKASAGILLLRLPRMCAREKAARALEAIDLQRDRLRHAFTVVEVDVLRRRPLSS